MTEASTQEGREKDGSSLPSTNGKTAIVKIGGRQFRVSEGDTLTVDLMQDIEVGNTLQLSDVLCIANGSQSKIGSPLVSGASVSARVLGEMKGEKLIAYRKRRRKGYRNKTGHRQRYTQLLVEAIQG